MADNNQQYRVPPRRGRMRRGGGPGAPPEKPKDFKKAVLGILKYLGGYKVLLVIVGIFAILSTMFQVVGPKILGNATTTLANGYMAKVNGTGTIDFDKIGRILLLVLIIYAVSAACSAIQGWIMSGITQKTVYKMRKQISDKIHRMPMKYFESVPYGDVLSRITNDVDTLGQSLNQSVTNFITSVTTIVGVFVMMLSISKIMTVIALVMIPISVILLLIVIKFSQKYFVTQQNTLGEINGLVEEDFAGQVVIQAFNMEETVIDTFESTNNRLYDSAWKSQFVSGVMMPAMQFVGNLGYVGVAISGAILAIRGTIGIGDIQAFIQYVRNFTQPLQQISQVTNQLQSMAAAAERIFSFLDEKEENLVVENPVELKNPQGAVKFDHVKFGYEPDKIIIHDFSADIKPGQKVAIVGPTGAGKTTIVKLLMRFYDVDAGAIYLDGEDIRDFNRYELRENFSMVLQDTWLFEGTIMENIRYGRLEATDEEVIKAAKAALAHKFIKTQPKGYKMVLNEDATNISEGQRQLLTIARAILSDCKVLILDEATSSVDTRTEEQIQKAMDNLMEGRTSFIIAHRLSTIKNADLILVMNHGDIIEQGTHEELLAQDGFYADLYKSQFDEVH